MDCSTPFTYPSKEDVEWLAEDIVTVCAYKPHEFHQVRSSFVDALHSFPEFVYDGEGPLVLGGFGGFGNPAAFHHPVVRRLRYDQETCVANAFRGKVPHDALLEIMFDRPCFRAAGTQYSEEKWHRDVGPEVAIGQQLWGGWLNLDFQSQVCKHIFLVLCHYSLSELPLYVSSSGVYQDHPTSPRRCHTVSSVRRSQPRRASWTWR